MKNLLTLLFICLGYTAFCQTTAPATVKKKFPRHQIGLGYGVLTDFQGIAQIACVNYRFAVTEEIGIGANAMYAFAGYTVELIGGVQVDYRIEASPKLYFAPAVSFNRAQSSAIGVHYGIIYKPLKFMALQIEPGALFSFDGTFMAPVKAGVQFIF